MHQCRRSSTLSRARITLPLTIVGPSRACHRSPGETGGERSVCLGRRGQSGHGEETAVRAQDMRARYVPSSPICTAVQRPAESHLTPGNLPYSRKSDAVIRTEGLRKQFEPSGYGSALTAVDSLDLEVRSGEVFGFLGPNGAGKTTTVRMLTALVAPSGGRAWVNGHDVRRDEMAVRRSVGVLTETPGL